MKEQVRKLWSLCFGDSEAFMDLYFEKKYSDDNNYAIEQDGNVVCAFQMLPHTLWLERKEFSTVYGSGLCTHPHYRGKGIGKVLVGQILKDLYSKGMMLTTLIPAEPWLGGYYHNLGYEYLFDVAYHTLYPTTTTEPNEIDVEASTACTHESYSYFHRKQLERNGVVLHSWDDYQTILADQFLAGGLLYTATLKQKLVGLAIVQPKENKEVLIHELFADNEDVKSALVKQIALEHPEQKVVQIVGVSDSTADSPIIHLGMGRIVNAESFLNRYAQAYPLYTLEVNLEDKEIPENNGKYVIADGKCTKSKTAEKENCKTISVNHLIIELLAKKNLYLSLMLN